MNKIIGAFSVFIAVLLMSYFPIYERKERSRYLFAWIHALSYIKAEYQTNLCALPVLVNLLCEHADWRVRPFFQTIRNDINSEGVAFFSQSLNDCLDQNKMYLNEQETSALRHLGKILGRFVLEEEVNEIEHTLEVFRSGYHETNQDLKEKERVYIGAGIVVSLMVIIMLL